MKFKKKHILIIIGIIIWSVLFVFLTPIILTVSDNNLHSSSIDLSLQGDQVYYCFDDIQSFNTLLSEVNIQGWAFVKTEKDDPNKSVKLIFVSDKVSYEVDMALITRNNLGEALDQENVPGLSGINMNFSPLSMRNGKYTLYIYVYENEEAYGIVNTHREFRKDYRSFVELVSGEMMQSEDFRDAITNDAVKWHFDTFEIIDDSFIISGWAFLENDESSKNQVYLEIQKPDGMISIYSTQTIYRTGLGEYFNDDRYNSAGFQAQLPKDAIGLGENIITVLINTDNRAIQSETFIWQGNLD